MKKLLLLLFVGILISCSKDDSPSNEKIIIPETYQVTYEVLGTGFANRIDYSTSIDESSSRINVSLPFRKTITHKNRKEGQGEGYAYEDFYSHHQILLRVHEYNSSAQGISGNVTEVNLYIDGKLEDSKNSGVLLETQLYLWLCEFRYVIRGRD